MATYKQLNQRHPSVDPERLADLRALYEGDALLEKRIGRFLHQRERERPQRYALRMREAQYRNYMGPIVDYFTSMLFTSRPVLKAKDERGEVLPDPGDYWTSLREDCDRGGTDIDALFKAVLTDAMIARAGWLRIHRPTDALPAPETRSDFDSRGLGEAWLERVTSEQVLDWDVSEEGRLEFAVVHRREAKRRSVSGERDRIVETWEWLSPESIDTYRIEYEAKKVPKPEDEVPRVSSVQHGFAAVPLVCLDLPPALWVASRLRSPQLAHFRKVNAQSWSLSATCYAMPVVKVADPEEYQKQASGAGYEIVLQQEDDFSWEAPPANHFAALDEEIKAEKDEIFRIAHQMALGVENNAAAVGRSAESKASDAETTRVVLVAFSRKVRETMEYALDLIAGIRGDAFRWSVEGLDDFAALDVAAFLENLNLLKTAGDVPSKTFQIEVNTRKAEGLLRDLDEATKATIRKEIQAGTEDPVKARERELEAAVGLFQGSGGNERPGEPGQGPPS